jgi:acyl carrier protein
MDIKTFYSTIEDIFEVDAGDVTGIESLSESELLNSLSIIGLISFLDKKCNLQMEPVDILKVGTINDLYQLVNKNV